MIRPRILVSIVVALSLVGAALAQETTTNATSAEDLLRALEAAGVDVSNITSVNEDGSVTVTLPEPAPAAEDGATAPDQEAADRAQAEAATPPAPTEKTATWDNKITLGFSYADGNTERANVNFLYQGVRETEKDKLTFGAAYFWAEDTGAESENKFLAHILYDRNISERWLIFGNGRYDYDEFQSWDQRVQAHGGLGYRLIKKDEINLILRAGAGAIREWGSDNDSIRPEGLFGFDFDWKITEAQAFVSTFRYFPDFDDAGEFRLVTTAGYEIKIDKADGLAVTVGLLHEHQSNVDPGRDNNDIRIFGGLTFDF